MCRNIRKLRRPDELPTEEELKGAALQFVRKITGYRAPSRRNTEAFDEAVAGIINVTRTLFQDLETPPSEQADPA